MKPQNRSTRVFAAALCFAFAACTAAGQSKSAPKNAKVGLPPAVAKAVKDNKPHAEIDVVTVETESGIKFYDMEFKALQGEMDVAEDGTVLDVATIVEAKDLPKAAMDGIVKAAAGARITRLERSEVRAELRTEGGKGKIVKLSAPKTLYEAEFLKGKRKGEVQVAPDGSIVEAVKWEGSEEPKAPRPKSKI